ncbi:MAG: hypothetical protein SGI88_15665 [Candidatus Hydrogenedentes bacterium]|nr:hypothetical protein [Candidatus Hydrogenedentota bacterium]
MGKPPVVLEQNMSDNFYPAPPSAPRNKYFFIAVLVALALTGGMGVGYALARSTWRADGEPLATTLTNTNGDAVSNLSATARVSNLPAGEFRPKQEEGTLLTYRLDAEIAGGGTEAGEFSEVYMNFGSDVSLYTKRVAPDGSADLRFTFENTGLAGTFFDSPFELRFSNAVQTTDNTDTPAGAPENPQTTFLSEPIEMRIGPDGEVLAISNPSSLKDMLGTIVTVPQLTFPEGELAEGRQWVTHLSLPVPGIANAVDTQIVNTFVGVERMGEYECGVVRQHLGATEVDTQASAPSGPNEEPMLFSVPLFDLTGENLIYFDTATGRLVHATLDMKFELRIKEQLGEAGNLLQQILPRLSGEEGAENIDDILSPEGKPDLMDLSLDIDGAFSLVNDGPPLPI